MQYEMYTNLMWIHYVYDLSVNLFLKWICRGEEGFRCGFHKLYEAHREAVMNIDSWIDGLRWLDVDQKVQVHFELQEQIKHHYRLRGEGDHLQRAIHLCEQSVAFAELALPALKEKWGRDFGGDFYPPESLRIPAADNYHEKAEELAASVGTGAEARKGRLG
ncbi:hypothetical protein HA44_01505 [Mixta gaviniae]|nr:hypothetical protein HA44_01505 [Mixta gaviniae]